METLILILVVSALNTACFFIGARVGQTASRGERIELPNPAKAHREREVRRVADKERDRIETILRNIERYDGTGTGQEDVPRG